MRDGVSGHQRLDCLLNRLFRHKSKKASKLRVNGLCEGNSPVAVEFPAQRASDAENVFVFLRHHSVRDLELIDERFFHRNSDSMKISLCFGRSCSEVIVMKFCTWQDSCAVVAWATSCSDMITYNGVILELTFHLTAMEKAFVKRDSWITNQIVSFL